MLTFGALALGENPTGLKIGVVNDEIESIESCKYARNKATDTERKCELKLISCQFLDEFNDKYIQKVNYNNFNEAYRDAKKGKLLAVFHFSRNFTKSYETLFFTDQDGFNDRLIEESQIEVYMDQSNHLLSISLRRQLFDAFKTYTAKLMRSCGSNDKLGLSPMNFLQPIYGDFNNDFKASIEPPIIVIVMFYIAACLSGFQFLEDRLCGSWNRVLMTGIDIVEVILSHMIIQIVILVIQLIEVLVIVKLTFPVINTEGMFLLAAITAGLQLSGLFFGMFMSCIVKSMPAVTFALNGLGQALLLISGEDKKNQIFHFTHDFSSF